MMRVSLNELESRYAKAIEAVGLPGGLAQDAARMAAWHDLWGLGGSTLLAACLTRLDGAALPAPQVRADADEVTLEAAGGSMLAAGPQALDLLEVAAARSPGEARVTVVNCADTGFAAGLAALAGERGLTVRLAAAGEDGGVIATAHGEKVSLARLGSGDPRLPAPGRAICRACDGLPKAPPADGEMLDADELGARAREAVDQGVAVDPAAWRSIYLLGARLLVLESEASRMHGAGGGSAND